MSGARSRANAADIARCAAGPRFSGFGFVLENESGFRLDADRGTLTCKTITGRDTTIALAFAPGELESTLRDFCAALEERSSMRHSVPPHSGERAVAGAGALGRQKAGG